MIVLLSQRGHHAFAIQTVNVFKRFMCDTVMAKTVDLLKTFIILHFQVLV